MRLALAFLLFSLALAAPPEVPTPPQPDQAIDGVVLGPPTAMAGISGTTWFPIGPAPVNKSQAPGNDWSSVNASGRATVLAVNPFNPDDVWMGTATGGVWHSIESGLGGTWKPMSDDQDSLAIGALALDDCAQAGCQTIYAGTGENAVRRDTYYGAGLLIGTINGPFDVSWTLKGKSLLEFSSINNVVLDPTTNAPNKRLYLTVSTGVTASASQATMTGPEPLLGYGIYKSENNGGSWSKLNVSGSDGVGATDLEMHPQDSNLLFAGFMGKGIFKGVRNPGDGTFTWCPLNAGIPVPPGCPDPAGNELPDPADPNLPIDHVELTIYEANPSIMYAVFGHCPKKTLDNCRPSIYRSDNGGVSWSEQYTGSKLKGNSFCPKSYTRYTHGLTILPGTPDTIFLSALRLCKSEDGGQSFSNSGVGGSALHYDLHSVVFPDPNDLDSIYVTTDGGFAQTGNGGGAWGGGNAGIQTIGFQTISSSHFPGADEVIGGTQDNGPLMWTGVRTWKRLLWGDSGSTVMDLGNKNRIYDTYHHDLIRRSLDYGDSWDEEMNSGIPADPPAAFYAPIVQDPSPPHALYFGTNRLYCSDDQAGSWSVKSPVLGGDVQQFDDIENSNVITTMAVAASQAKRIYVGYYDGQIWRTKDVAQAPCDDEALCWQDVTGNPLPAAAVTSIAVDPNDEDVAYAAFSGFATDAHVFKTENGGVSWSASSGPDPGNPLNPASLPALPANVIRVEPASPSTLWLGTDNGIYKSTDAGVTWSRFSQGLPNVPVYDISIDETRGRVFAGTHGRGAFLLTGPFAGTYSGWVNGGIWDIPVYGYGFSPNLSCSMRLILQDGQTCAEGPIDAHDGTMMTDGTGKFSTLDVFDDVQPLGWACYGGECVGGVDVSECEDLANPLTSVLIDCEGEVAIGAVSDCPQQANPPSTLFNFDGNANMPFPGGFNLTVSVQTGDGSTRPFCTVRVPVDPSDSSAQVLTRARDAVNANSVCAAQNVSAGLQALDPSAELDREDAPGGAASLFLDAPGVSGGRLVTSLHVAPGDAPGACFYIDRLDSPLLDALTIMRVRFETGTAGAAGGTVRLVEGSLLGSCDVTVTTDPGDTDLDVAAALEKAFAERVSAGCPALENPRDVTQDRDSVTTVLASQLTVCVDDPGIGFSVRPEELENVHPVADAGGDEAIECAAATGTLVPLDGTASFDPDSTPTVNDIVAYEWFENFGLPMETSLGSGPLQSALLGLGDHTITLRVTDSVGQTDLRTVTKSVVDTVPPTISGSVDPSLLWPPNHRMLDVAAALSAGDTCSSATLLLESVLSDEPDDAPGGGDGETVDDVQQDAPGTGDFDFLLRAERDAGGDGRDYAVSYTATDTSGNSITLQAAIQVPLLQGGTAEPLILTLRPGSAGPGTVVEWPPVAGALYYNVIRGDLANLVETTSAINLGAVLCLEAGSLDPSTEGDADFATPAPGQAFFYLAEYDDGSPSSYGTESADKPRVPGPGACVPFLATD